MANRPAVTVANSKRMIANKDCYPNLCLKATRTALGIPSKYASAISAWRNIPRSKRHSGIAPPGYPMFFGIGRYGHVVISLDGKGLVASNMSNWYPRGIMKAVSYKLFSNYLGWSTQLNGVDIPPPLVPHTVPTHVYVPAKYVGPIMPNYPTRYPAQIKEVQNRFGLKVDGIYGPKSVAGVVAWQRRHTALGKADGIIGPKTYAYILKNVPRK